MESKMRKLKEKLTKEMNIKFSDEDWEKLKTLQDKYALNISCLFRNFIRQKFSELENK